jgi:hypothetical protein
MQVGSIFSNRHGIALASIREAKMMGAKVGISIWQDRQLCPA